MRRPLGPRGSRLAPSLSWAIGVAPGVKSSTKEASGNKARASAAKQRDTYVEFFATFSAAKQRDTYVEFFATFVNFRELEPYQLPMISPWLRVYGDMVEPEFPRWSNRHHRGRLVGSI